MWNISDSSRGCIKSIRMHSTYVRVRGWGMTLVGGVERVGCDPCGWGEGVGCDPCGWGGGGGDVTLVQHCLCACLMCFYLFWLWQVMCLEVGSGLLFSADYEGNLRSWMLDSLEVVGSVVSAHMHTHTHAHKYHCHLATLLLF